MTKRYFTIWVPDVVNGGVKELVRNYEPSPLLAPYFVAQQAKLNPQAIGATLYFNGKRDADVQVWRLDRNYWMLNILVGDDPDVQEFQRRVRPKKETDD